MLWLLMAVAVPSILGSFCPCGSWFFQLPLHCAFLQCFLHLFSTSSYFFFLLETPFGFLSCCLMLHSMASNALRSRGWPWPWILLPSLWKGWRWQARICIQGMSVISMTMSLRWHMCVFIQGFPPGLLHSISEAQQAPPLPWGPSGC